MANIQPLVDYLKLYRRSHEKNEKETHTEAVIIDDLFTNNSADNRTLNVLKTDLEKTYNTI